MLRYLHDVDLNLLHTFRTFVELGTIAATARDMGRSQPAISARLKQLQEELGVTLLERHGRRLRLTSIGRGFDAELRIVLGRLAHAIEEARAATEMPMGTLRIGVLPTAHVHVLAPRLAVLSRAHPRISIDVRPGNVAAHLDSLRSGNIDAVLGVGDIPRDDLEVDILAEARAVVVVPSGCQRSMSTNALREESWLSYGATGDPFFEAVLRFFSDSGMSERVIMTVPHIDSIKALIRAGAGIGILPSYTILPHDELETREVPGLDIRRPLWLAVRRASVANPLIAALRSAAAVEPLARE